MIAAGLLVATAHAQQTGAVLRDCDGCTPMVVIPAGSFTMGTAADEVFSGSTLSPQGSRGAGIATGVASPQHQVTITKAFALAQHEVTYAEFAAFIADSGYELGITGCTLVDVGTDPDVFSRDTAVNWQVIKNRSWKYPLWPNVNDNNPVTCVTWNDAQAYAAWLSKRTGHVYRLPTEAEWEYAARAGTTGFWFWGNDPAQACEYANVPDLKFLKQRRRTATAENHFECDDAFAFNAPVASFKANSWKVYDLVGNVAEWTADCWHGNYNGAPSDGGAWLESGCAQRVVRGDSGTLHIDWTHVSYRAPQIAGDYRSNVLGFRVVREL